MAVIHVPVKLRESGRIHVTETKEVLVTRLRNYSSNDLVPVHEVDSMDLTAPGREIQVKHSLIQMVED